MFHFFAAVSSQWWCICVAEHICCSKVVNSKVDHETSRCQIIVNKSNLTVGVKHSISRRTTFSPNLHLVQDVCPFCNINVTTFPLHILNRWLWIGEIIFKQVFHIFFGVNGSFSVISIILSFLLQSYKIAKLQPSWIFD